MTQTKTGFAAYIKTATHKIPVFASKKHCFFKTRRQAERRLELIGRRLNANACGHIYDRTSGDLVWTIAL